MTYRQSICVAFEKLGYDQEHTESFCKHMEQTPTFSKLGLTIDSEVCHPDFHELITKMFAMEMPTENN